MNGAEMELFERLLNAAKAGECPDPNCKICKDKWETIAEAESFLASNKRQELYRRDGDGRK